MNLVSFVSTGISQTALRQLFFIQSPNGNLNLRKALSPRRRPGPNFRRCVTGGQNLDTGLRRYDRVFRISHKHRLPFGAPLRSKPSQNAPMPVLHFLTISRRCDPTYNCRGRPILYSGSAIISLSCAIHPTVRASAKIAVKSGTGIPIAFCTMPE